MPSKELPLAQQRSKRVMAVRMWAGRSAWLDGRLRWEDGRIVWEGRRGRLAPDAADLARGQRCLNKIARYPIAAEQALGEARQWLSRRRARLELAKRLCALPTADLP